MFGAAPSSQSRRLLRNQGECDMTSSVIVLIVLGLAVLGYFLGRQRALTSSGREKTKLHSLPAYYGQSVALFVAVPALLLLAAWLFLQPVVIEASVSGKIPESAVPEGGAKSLVMVDVRRIADGLNLIIAQGGVSEDDLASMRADVSDIRGRLAEVGVALGSDVSPVVFDAAKEYRSKGLTASLIRNPTSCRKGRSISALTLSALTNGQSGSTANATPSPSQGQDQARAQASLFPI